MNNAPKYWSRRYGHVGDQEVPDNTEWLEDLVHGGDEDVLRIVVRIIINVGIDRSSIREPKCWDIAGSIPDAPRSVRNDVPICVKAERRQDEGTSEPENGKDSPTGKTLIWNNITAKLTLTLIVVFPTLIADITKLVSDARLLKIATAPGL